MSPARMLATLLALAIALVSCGAEAAPVLHVGSKRFTESYILAEIVAALARAEGIEVEHERGLGGTAVVYRALEQGSIDVYPEYTGTIAETVLHVRGADLERIRSALADGGLGISPPLGFEDTYALAVSRRAAWRTVGPRISELRGRKLRIVLSPEFLGRSDGWPGLAAYYHLDDLAPSALDHALAYEALANGSADVTDVYTTDAKIDRYGLVVLADDLHFFPRYAAVLLHRGDVMARFPALGRVFARLAGAIDEATMRRLNGRCELEGASFEEVAAEYVRGEVASPKSRAGTHGDDSGTAGTSKRSFLAGLGEVIVRHGVRHVALVSGSLSLATLLGVPLGVFAYERRRLGAVVLGVTGIVQTIPSLALFCFFIPLFGIGPVPALAALFLYGLLPIVRNTHAGLSSVPLELRETALALGLSRWERMRHVELPLASRTILAGIKTSAVVAVGTATIAAFIGAGGFGDPISTGLSLNDVPMILQGSLPAAAFALIVQALFAALERVVSPEA